MVYGHIVGTSKIVCKIAPVGQICGPFLAPNRPKYVNMWVFVYFLENFPLESHETWFISWLELLI